jgi:hypothetical protein
MVALWAGVIPDLFNGGGDLQQYLSCAIRF